MQHNPSISGIAHVKGSGPSNASEGGLADSMQVDQGVPWV